MRFPYAGGSASYYHPLAQSPTLLPDTEVLAVQYPGRQDRRSERLIDDIPELADGYRAAELYQWAPAPPLTCPVTTLVGERDRQAAPDDVAAWREHTEGPFDLKLFSGGHFCLNTHQQGLTEVVSKALVNRAQQTATARGDAR
ncbi:thioesterase II family protein [Streptomyces sp. NPDC101227]|uniref:thioesterase II family protein n=1 Tax=Streptomyces sp. NPDC101227 TaxID=3366136 RepID=UPI0037FB7A07